MTTGPGLIVLSRRLLACVLTTLCTGSYRSGFCSRCEDILQQTIHRNESTKSVPWVGSLIDTAVWGASQVQLFFFLLSSILIAPSLKILNYVSSLKIQNSTQ